MIDDKKNAVGLYSVIVPTYNEAENIPILVYLLEEISETQ